MSDLNDDGATAPVDDNALFSSVVSGETEAPASDPTLEPAPSAPVAQQLETPSQPQQSEPAIPPSRLREEADARRAAERRADEFERRLAAMQPKPEPKPRSDVFENPSSFVQEEVRPLIDPVTQEIGQLREFYSQRDAVREHGAEKVKAAYDAMDQALRSGDPDAQATYQRARKSLDPFGDIVKWHQKATVFSEIGNDVEAYRQRIIEDALKNPDIQKRALEAARLTASQSGNVVTTPARPAVSSLPSLNKVGAVALPEGQDEVSDAELFTKTTSRKRA